MNPTNEQLQEAKTSLVLTNTPMKDNPDSLSQSSDRTPLEPNELYRGDWWRIFQENGAYVLEYLTGGVAVYEARIPISKLEAEGLITGELDVLKVLRAHGGG